MKHYTLNVMGKPHAFSLAFMLQVPLFLGGWVVTGYNAGLLAFVLSYFFGIFAHEYAHAWAAKLVGAKVQRYRFKWRGAAVQVIFPKTFHPDSLRVVVIAGPLVNLLCAVSLYAWGSGMGSGVGDLDWTEWAAYPHVFLALINLLPFPGLDGHYFIYGPSKEDYVISDKAALGFRSLTNGFAGSRVAQGLPG